MKLLHSTKIIVLLLLAIVLSSCGNSTRRNKNNLIYWSSNNQQEIEFAREIVNGWNKKHPDQKVSTQPVPEGQSSEEMILAAVVGNTTPDIYSNMWEGSVENYARSGVLVALDTLAGFKKFIYSRDDSSVIKEITSKDGHIYQVPWKINPVMMIYNKKDLKEVHFKAPPSNYGQYFLASKRFKKDLNGDGYIDQWFGYSDVIVTWWQRLFDFYPLYIAASNGAPLIKNDTAAFNNKYAVGVFKFLRTLYKNNYFPRERSSTRQDIFLSGIIATRFTGPWEIPYANKFKPKGFQYDFAHIPVPDNHKGPIYTYSDPKNIVIFKTAPNPELAWKFIKYMISKKNDLKFLKLTNQLPMRKNLEVDSTFKEYFKLNPKMLIFANQAKHIKGMDQYPNLTEVFDIISQEYEESVVYGRKSPEQAIKDAAKQVNLLYLK